MDNRKIIVLVGCSGSGKSTFAHQQWLKDPLNTIIISRDNIRYMFGYTEETVSEFYNREDLKELENEVTSYQDSLINKALNKNKTIILDNTNLRGLGYLKNQWKVPVEAIYFDIDLQEAIERDSKRLRKVGEEVIRKQYEQYKRIRKESKTHESKDTNDIS